MDTKKKTTFSTKELAIIPIFAALTAVLAQIAIPLPFSPVPISFGLVAVYITALLLKPKHAVYAQVCYLLLGAIGLPVSGNFQGGLSALFGPTGGYLLTYPIITWIVSFTINSKRSLQVAPSQGKGFIFLKTGIAIVIAHLFLYLGGTVWLSISTGNTFYASLALAVIPFIPLDIVKILFCVFAVIPFRSRLKTAGVLMLDDYSRKPR